jgi:4-alpha-glucanotransferase
MRRHGLSGMYAAYFNISPDSHPPVRRPGSDDLACVNTHDLPPFAQWLDGGDIRLRESLGILSAPQVRSETASRRRILGALVRHMKDTGLVSSLTPEPTETLRGVVAYLCGSRARSVMLNAEDLWLETAPQNVPGTSVEHPNWQRIARHPLEEWAALDEKAGVLQACGRARARR